MLEEKVPREREKGKCDRPIYVMAILYQHFRKKGKREKFCTYIICVFRVLDRKRKRECYVSMCTYCEDIYDYIIYKRYTTSCAEVIICMLGDVVVVYLHKSIFVGCY